MRLPGKRWDIAAYVIANAFGMGVEFDVLIMGLVGAYIARLIPLSPGGIGQFEWGFAMALYLGGVGLPEAATIAILDNAIRYVSGTLILGSVLLRYGVETNLRAVLDLFAGPAETSQGERTPRAEPSTTRPAPAELGVTQRREAPPRSL